MSEIEQQDAIIEPTETDETEDAVETPVETEDPAELKARIKELEEKAIAQRERGKITKAELTKLKGEIAKLQQAGKPESKPTGELNDAVLDFFELKGYDEEQIQVFQNVMKRTGLNHREVLKDEYAIAKATAIQKKKELQDATPSGTKRPGGQVSNDVDYWVAKVEQGGELPKDFELRTKVIDKLTRNGDTSIPPWRR